MMKFIDVENWARKTAYQNFVTYTNPTFSVGTRFDVTNLVLYCKKNNLSFFATFLYVVSKCANQIEELKIRIVDGKPVIFDTVHPSYVVLCDDNHITTCQTDYLQNFESFHNNTKRDVEFVKKNWQQNKFNTSDGADCLYISCLPWIDVRSFSNPYNYTNQTQTSIPRIIWGKYVKNSQDRYEMGFDVSVHHALIDGFQVSQFICNVSNALNNVEEFLRSTTDER